MSPRGVVFNVQYRGEFELQSHYYDNFRTNIFGKVMNSLSPSVMDEIVSLLGKFWPFNDSYFSKN